MYQIFSAINYYNGLNIIHRDLKPGNILIVNKNKNNNYPNIKICDFGISKIAKENYQKSLVGTLYYIAPEVLEKKYNEKIDMWSSGVIMYNLLSGKTPFDGSNAEILDKIKKGEYDITIPPLDKMSPSAKDLMQKLLTVDVNKRISVKEALQHPWFKEQNSKELYNKILDEKIVQKLLTNLKNYKKNSIIQETALAYLVHNFPQMKDVINACKLFNQIDLNGDGKITEEELYLGLKKRLNSGSLVEDVKKIFSVLDMNNDGFIEYEEFVRAAVSKEKFMGENVLKFAFRFFDKDNSGKIELKEIETIFKKSVNDKEHMDIAFNKIIFEVDKNRDGKISFEEFSKVMKKMLD
jgi:calcium-dependent protein kinase